MIVLEPVCEADEPQVRALLRQEMQGQIRLSLEREPDSRLAAAVEGERHHLFIGRDTESGQVAGIAGRTVRRVWLDGRQVRLGYLTQLRAAVGAPLRRHQLVQGFKLCEQTRQPDEEPFDLTSIMADNRVARRLLERGLSGLPTYTPIAELTTLLLPVSRRSRPDTGRGGALIRCATVDDLGAIAGHLQRCLCRYNMAPVWTAAELESEERCRGLDPEDLLLASEAGHLAGCAAIWDQQAFKQTVVRGYAAPLRLVRPFLNLGLALAGRPTLPRAGARVRLAFLSHLAAVDDRPEIVMALLHAACHRAAARGLTTRLLGRHRADPVLDVISRGFPVRQLRSLLYLVHRQDPAELRALVAGRLVRPEVATL